MTKQQIPSEFQDSSLTSQRLVVGEELLRQATNNELGALRIDDFRDGRVAAKPVSYYANSNPSSSSISVMTFSGRSVVGEDGNEVKKTDIDSKENFTAGVASSGTLFSADSMTKMITAAAMLRMSEEEKHRRLLPNGIETKLSDILPILKEHYPHSTYLQRELETQPNFDQITLQHLAQHTSGLARVSRDASNKKLQEAAGEKLTLDAMIDADKLPKSGKYGENIGEYSYNDLGYELLGRIVIAIASETTQSPQKFGDVVNELVIDEIRKKVGPEESVTLKFFTSDQMEINENGKTQVKGHPELRVEFGKHYHDQKFSEVPSHTYDLSCGGSYTTGESMSMIALHILSGEQEFSIFKEPQTRDVFNLRQVPIPRLTPDGKYKGPGFRVYGFGYESFSIPGYERYRDHGGLGYGSNSNVMVDTKKNKVATTMVAFEDLTLPLAYALTNKEKPTSAINLDPILHQKTLELSENHSESQLLEMRNSLEKSYEDFREKFDLLQKQRVDLEFNKKPPLPNSERTYTEKMSQVKGMTRPQQALKRIATDENFHGIAAISGHDAVTNITGVSSETPFPIHSVGKILSGVLMVEMVTQGVITESDLITPGVRLQPEIEEKLTRENPAVIERLSQVSILQAMQHTAGLASLNEKSGSKDCIDNYTKHLREGKETRHSMGDMVDFVGDKLTEIGPEKYSNDGLLLAGCALQNLYNSRTGQNLSYEEILNKLVIEPSKTNISMTRPVDVHYKAEDVEHLSKYPVTPAGGHFASTDDLLKLGEYLYQRCQDQEFIKGVKKYGAEFYDKDRNAIYHGGYMEGTTVEAKGSATEFAVSLNDGKTIAILMDRDASEDDRNSRRLSQTHARGFYKELRNSLEQENELHKPKIALITPGLSGDTDGSTIEQDAEKLKSLGFRVEFLPGSVSNSHPFVGAKIANTAEQRARQVINFAQDPEVVAMWAVNGGESCPEVAKLLVEYGKDPQKYLEKHQVDCVSGEILGYAAGAENGFPKDRLLPTIIGMSDVSSIQLSLAQFGFPSHYGSLSLANVEYLQRMSEVVQKGTVSELEQITQISRQDAPEKMSGTVYATVNGGLESSLHTDWQPKFPPNTVLMIEGVSGYDAIASTLNKAKQAGALANVSAILVGNPVDPGQGINPESRERFTKFAGEFDLPIFSVGGNQFGHLAGKEPTPIANFGNIEIDTRLGAARIEQGSVRENILQFHAEKVAAPRVEFEAQQLGINPPALELTSINQHPIPTELTDMVGGKGRSLPTHLNLAGKTLLVDYSNWVELGRQMTDIANRGELEGVKAIIFSVDNHYPELKSRFDSAKSEQEKVAVGLSFITHPDFKFSHNSENTYRCDNATKERAEISFIPWLKSRGIELEAKDILVDGEGITLPIPIERNSEIIAQVTNEKSIGFVRQSAGRAEYFAKQHPEIPVFLTDRSNLPEVMRGPLFSAERLEVLQNKSEKETDERFAKKSWVDRISNSNQSRDDSVIKR